jgi:hypothetical protein
MMRSVQCRTIDEEQFLGNELRFVILLSSEPPAKCWRRSRDAIIAGETYVRRSTCFQKYSMKVSREVQKFPE